MTEKNYNPEQAIKKSTHKQQAAEINHHAPTHGHTHEHANVEKTTEKSEVKEKTEENSSKRGQVKKRPKKTEAVVNAKDIPVSTKHSMAICNFVKGKKISIAVSQLEEVAKLKRAIPMRGEIPHRHGDMMSGRFPQKAAKEFIILLKSLAANATYNGIESPVVFAAKANLGNRPFGKGGVRKKRTHITLVARTIGVKK